MEDNHASLVERLSDDRQKAKPREVMFGNFQNPSETSPEKSSWPRLDVGTLTGNLNISSHLHSPKPKLPSPPCSIASTPASAPTTCRSADRVGLEMHSKFHPLNEAPSLSITMASPPPFHLTHHPIPTSFSRLPERLGRSTQKLIPCASR